MRIPIGLILFLMSTPLTLMAQASEEVSVEAVINRLFTGMHQADSTMVRSVFAADVTMVTVSRTKEGTPVLRKDSVDDFIKAVGQKPPEPLTEEIWNMKIQTDGDFAQAWCDYAFYVGHRFNHCGVDAFHLIKTTEGWKIFHLADTRRKVDCHVPEEIQKKHH
jgi:hypothetical protein